MGVHDEAVVARGWSVSDVLRRILWGHKTLLAGFVVLGVAGGLAWASSSATTYQAGTELVTGTYSVPQEVGLDEALDGAGPLGLELPAETQARILTSPAVVSLAVDSLALDQDASLELLTTASARPITDNVFTVSAAGPTPTEAAQRANAVAAAYLDYRQARATEKLSPLREEALARAATAQSASDGLQPRITSAQAADDIALAAALVAQQQQLEVTVEQETALATTIDSWLSSFAGGGTVVRPADAGDAVGGVSTSRTAAAGLLSGLILGLGVAFLLERLRSPLRTSEDVADVVGATVPILDERDDRTGVVAARTVWRHRTLTVDRWELSVVPAAGGHHVGGVARWLAGGLEALGHRAVVEQGGPSAAGPAHAAAHAAADPATPHGTGPLSTSPHATSPLAVRITEMADVAALCLDVMSAADETRDVIVVVTLGKDSTRVLRETAEALSATGLTVAGVMLRRHGDAPHRSGRVGGRWRGGAAAAAPPVERSGDGADPDRGEDATSHPRDVDEHPHDIDDVSPGVDRHDAEDGTGAEPADDADAADIDTEDEDEDGSEDDQNEDDESDEEVTDEGAENSDPTASGRVADAVGGHGGRRR